MSVDPRYDARDFATPRSIRAAHYDRLRDAGVPRENAERITASAVEKTQRKIDQGVGFNARAPHAHPIDGGAGSRRNPFRVRFDFEPENAGITIDARE